MTTTIPPNKDDYEGSVSGSGTRTFFKKIYCEFKFFGIKKKEFIDDLDLDSIALDEDNSSNNGVELGRRW